MGRQIAGQHRYCSQQPHYLAHCYRVSSTDAVEHPSDETSESERQQESEDETRYREPDALHEHELQHVGARCPERHTDADFVCAELRAIGHHAVDTRCGQHQSDDGENSGKGAGQNGEDAGDLRGFAQRTNIEDCELPIYLMDRIFDCRRDCTWIATGLNHYGWIIGHLEKAEIDHWFRWFIHEL